MNATPEERGAARDPNQLEREASEIRADMDRTLDALERKFSPGQLLDRSMGYLREHGAELTRNVGDTVRHNPVPALMTAAGVVWLISSTLRSRKADGDTRTTDEEQADNTSGRRRGKLHDRVTATRERMRASRDAVANTVSDKASTAMEATRTRVDRVQNRVQTLIDEQPLVLGALAVAAGAVIGAILPSTQYENRTVGQVRDRTLAKAKEVGEQQYENLRGKLETREDGQGSGGRVN
jgi:ElaB/YqjD/DUF883 family membrane-anchored ribosome-binding protein